MLVSDYTSVCSGTALSLLEAQAAVGSISDPRSGDQMSLDEAVERNLLDDELASLLRRAERAVTGWKPKGSDETLSLFQAMKRVSGLKYGSYFVDVSACIRLDKKMPLR